MDTKLAKPNAVSANSAELLYCIDCEAMVKAEREDGLYHIIINEGEEIYCFFGDGYAYSAPPADLPDDWASQEADDDQKAELEQEETGFWAEVWK